MERGFERRWRAVWACRSCFSFVFVFTSCCWSLFLFMGCVGFVFAWVAVRGLWKFLGLRLFYICFFVLVLRYYLDLIGFFECIFGFRIDFGRVVGLAGKGRVGMCVFVRSW